MSPMAFPRMFVSRGDGWTWLMRLHPSAAKLYFYYVVPLSIIPPAMFLYAWSAYRSPVPAEAPAASAIAVAAVLFVAELAAVPLMARAVQGIGHLAGLVPTYADAFALAAVAPTPLWVMPLFLFVPSFLANVLVLALALFGACVLIYQGAPGAYYLEDEARARLLAGCAIGAGLAAFAAVALLALAAWGVALLV